MIFIGQNIDQDCTYNAAGIKKLYILDYQDNIKTRFTGIDRNKIDKTNMVWNYIEVLSDTFRFDSQYDPIRKVYNNTATFIIPYDSADYNKIATRLLRGRFCLAYTDNNEVSWVSGFDRGFKVVGNYTTGVNNDQVIGWTFTLTETSRWSNKNIPTPDFLPIYKWIDFESEFVFSDMEVFAIDPNDKSALISDLDGWV